MWWVVQTISQLDKGSFKSLHSSMRKELAGPWRNCTHWERWRERHPARGWEVGNHPSFLPARSCVLWGKTTSPWAGQSMENRICKYLLWGRNSWNWYAFTNKCNLLAKRLRLLNNGKPTQAAQSLYVCFVPSCWERSASLQPPSKGPACWERNLLWWARHLGRGRECAWYCWLAVKFY